MLLAQRQSSHLTDEVIAHCKKAGIITVVDFLSIDAETLSQKIGVPYKDIAIIGRMLVGIHSSFIRTGDLYFKDQLQTLLIMSTGCQSLDEYLVGGIYTEEITEIHGCTGTGKTQLCLSIASSVIASTNNTVLYLDTNSAFSGNRFKQMLLQKLKKPQDVKDKLKMLHVLKPHDIYELFDILLWIIQHLKLQDDSFLSKLKLLVLDSITPLISTCFGASNGQSLLARVAQLLKFISKLQSLSVLVCNNMVRFENSVKPAMGHYWSFVPSVRLHLEKNDMEGNSRSISVVKSHRRASFGKVFVSITENGLFSVEGNRM